MCQFPNCDRHPGPNGYCIGHASFGGAVAAKKKTGIEPKSAKKIAAEKSAKEQRKDGETELQEWFARIMKEEKPVCWETGEKIDKKDVKGWHGSIAHVLPKKTFKSVATHPGNYLVLKMWGGTHARYDVSWASASKMKVWPEAVKRFLEMYDSIADNEKKYIPDVFLVELEKRSQ